jgi:hypothetical protein
MWIAIDEKCKECQIGLAVCDCAAISTSHKCQSTQMTGKCNLCFFFEQIAFFLFWYETFGYFI